MLITRDVVANELSAYLRHETSLPGLVDWAENALMNEEFDSDVDGALRDVVARIGLSDVREFGMSWEDCEEMLHRLGFVAHLYIRRAA